MCIYKTGALARFSAKLGAIIGAASEKQVSVLGNFAASIGVAFQIQDDILNIAPPEKWGKEIGDDINEGKRTLLVIHAVKNTSEKNAKRLVEILNSHTNKKAEILEAIGIIKETGAIEYAKEKAKAIVEASWRALDSEIESSAAKQLLKGFADFVVEREI